MSINLTSQSTIRFDNFEYNTAHEADNKKTSFRKDNLCDTFELRKSNSGDSLNLVKVKRLNNECDDSEPGTISKKEEGAIESINYYMSRCEFEKTLPCFSLIQSEQNKEFRASIFNECSNCLNDWTILEEASKNNQLSKEAEEIAQKLWSKFGPQEGEKLSPNQKFLKSIVDNITY